MKPTAPERFAVKAVAAAAALILAMTAQALPLSYLIELERAKIEPAGKLGPDQLEKALLNPDWVELAKTMQPNYSQALPMRPRAVLHATAICLLLAAATVWAAPPGLIPQTARGQKAASTAQKPALPGPLSEQAESRLKALSALPGSLGERPESRLAARCEYTRRPSIVVSTLVSDALPFDRLWQGGILSERQCSS